MASGKFMNKTYSWNPMFNECCLLSALQAVSFTQNWKRSESLQVTMSYIRGVNLKFCSKPPIYLPTY